jgi:secreted trypsin-like serine protease
MSNFFDLRIRWLCVLAASTAMLPNSAALAGTIRHDRSDQLYRSAARNPALKAVVQTMHFSRNEAGSCSGTLIAPEWVLFASHCVWPNPLTQVRPLALIEVGGQVIQVGPDDIFINPEWLSSFSVRTTIGDIALIRLPRPVAHIQPIGLNNSFQEVGKWGYIAGFGRTGTGRSGSTAASEVRRVGTNVIDGTEATVVFPSRFPARRAQVGDRRALLIDFDNSRRDSSTLGDSEPLNMEYSAAQGDSGGPLLLYSNEVFTVGGVVSGGIQALPSVSPVLSFYGTVGTFARVASYRQWIQDVMSGRGHSLSQMFRDFTPADAVAAQQRFAAEQQANFRNGISVNSFQLIYVLPPPPQLAERLTRKPQGGILTLASDAAANIRRLGEQAEQDDLRIASVDCVCCGGEATDDQ